MNLTNLQFEIIELSTEDNYGLWELLESYSKKSPELEEKEIINKCALDIKHLYKNKLVELYEGKNLSECNVVEEKIAVEDILNSSDNFKQPTNRTSTVYSIAATELGEKLYNETYSKYKK